MKTTHSDELDLAIANMDSAEAERAVSALLKPLPGVHAVRLIERGAWIGYDGSVISREEISTVLHHAGFRGFVSRFEKWGDGLFHGLARL